MGIWVSGHGNLYYYIYTGAGLRLDTQLAARGAGPGSHANKPESRDRLGRGEPFAVVGNCQAKGIAAGRKLDPNFGRARVTRHVRQASWAMRNRWVSVSPSSRSENADS